MITIAVHHEGKTVMHNLKYGHDYLEFFEGVIWKGGDWKVVTKYEDILDIVEQDRFRVADFVKRITWALLNGWTITHVSSGNIYSLKMSKREIDARMFLPRDELRIFVNHLNDLLRSIHADLDDFGSNLELDRGKSTLYIHNTEQPHLGGVH